MQPVTVTGSRPSDDFQVTKGSINRLGAGDLMDVPQTVVVINKALMQSQGITTLENAVRNVPGVTIGSAEGGTIGTNINLNGFSARTDIYLDGMRDRGQYYRDLFALEQVEVLMGPSSMLFGRGSTGGVINQVMKKPIAQERDGAQRPGDDQRSRAHDGRRQRAVRPGQHQRGPRLRDVPGRQGVDDRPDQCAGFRPRAVGQAGHRNAHRDHAVGDPAAQEGPWSPMACRR